MLESYGYIEVVLPVMIGLYDVNQDGKVNFIDAGKT